MAGMRGRSFAASVRVGIASMTARRSSVVPTWSRPLLPAEMRESPWGPCALRLPASFRRRAKLCHAFLAPSTTWPMIASNLSPFASLVLPGCVQVVHNMCMGCVRYASVSPPSSDRPAVMVLSAGPRAVWTPLTAGVSPAIEPVWFASLESSIGPTYAPPARQTAPSAISVQQIGSAWAGRRKPSRAIQVSFRRAVDRLEEVGMVRVHRFASGRPRSFVSLTRRGR